MRQAREAQRFRGGQRDIARNREENEVQILQEDDAKKNQQPLGLHRGYSSRGRARYWPAKSTAGQKKEMQKEEQFFQKVVQYAEGGATLRQREQEVSGQGT